MFLHVIGTGTNARTTHFIELNLHRFECDDNLWCGRVATKKKIKKYYSFLTVCAMYRYCNICNTRRDFTNLLLLLLLLLVVWWCWCCCWCITNQLLFCVGVAVSFTIYIRDIFSMLFLCLAFFFLHIYIYIRCCFVLFRTHSFEKKKTKKYKHIYECVILTQSLILSMVNNDQTIYFFFLLF